MRRGLLLVGVGLLLSTSCTRAVSNLTATLTGGPPAPSVSGSSPPAPTGGVAATGPTGARAAIRILEPSSEATISSPVWIRGTADAFEGVVSLQIVDATGAVLAATTAQASCGTGCRGRFHAKLAFYAPAREAGAIEAYEVSPKDGSIRHLVRVDVTLLPGA